MPVFVSHTPGGTSTQNVLHWAQTVNSGKPEMYDFQNAQENIKHYGQAVPPVYDFTKVNTDVYLFHSPADWLADSQDVEEFLIPSLNPSILKGNVKLDDFNHMDFAWGLRAAEEVYYPIIDIIQKDLNIAEKETKIQKKLERIGQVHKKLIKNAQLKNRDRN